MALTVIYNVVVVIRITEVRHPRAVLYKRWYAEVRLVVREEIYISFNKQILEKAIPLLKLF